MPILETIGTIGTAAGGAGQLAGGIGSLVGGGGQQRDPLKWQKRDWYEYSKGLSMEIMQHMRNEIARHQYEGFPGARNLATAGMGAVRGMMETPPPDYQAQVESKYGDLLKTGFEGVPETPEGGYFPPALAVKSPEEITKWDKIAEENGIMVTKYKDFNNPMELAQELYQKNKAEVTVSQGEQLIGIKIMQTLFPDLCQSGVYQGGTSQICFALGSEVMRGLKAWIRTGTQIGKEFFPGGELSKKG